MEYKLTKGNKSNFEIVTTIDDQQIAEIKEEVLKMYQKDINIPGFRKGYAPLSIVEKHIKDEYLKMSILEEIINKILHKVIEENKDIKFIGHIYDLNEKQEDGKTFISFKLDVYPEVVVKNDNWKALHVDKVEADVGQEELDSLILSLRKQYASYEDTDAIADDTVFKVNIIIYTDGNVVKDYQIYMGIDDFVGFDDIKGYFVGKKVGDTIKLDYNENLAKFLNYKGVFSYVEFKIIEIKKQIIPEFDDQIVQKIFGENVKTVQDAINVLKDHMKEHKMQDGIIHALDKFVELCKQSFDICIPDTMLHEEVKARLEDLKKRLGGEKGFESYKIMLGDEKMSHMISEITEASRKSLEKYFIFDKLVELLDLKANVDYNKPMDVENKLYEKLLK